MTSGRIPVDMAAIVAEAGEVEAFLAGDARMGLVIAQPGQGIGKLHGIVIDCADPDPIAHFYQHLLGMERVQDDGDWIIIGDSADRPGIAFARVASYRPTTWPDGERPQYRHFEIRVEDLDIAETEALAIGATRLAGGTESSRIFADPVGHPFCLILLPDPLG